VRHLIVTRPARAHDPNDSTWPNDDERPLTDDGVRKFRVAARGLAWLVDPPEELLTSSLTRARQTAEILEREAGFPAAVEIAELRPDAKISAVVAALKKRRATRIAIVGHEPNLSLLVGALLRGVDSRTMLELKKGAVAQLDFVNGIDTGKGKLLGLMQPRALRGLARAKKNKKKTERRTGRTG
jgi:phosphohistidine phosphatase